MAFLCLDLWGRETVYCFVSCDSTVCGEASPGVIGVLQSICWWTVGRCSWFYRWFWFLFFCVYVCMRAGQGIKAYLSCPEHSLSGFLCNGTFLFPKNLVLIMYHLLSLWLTEHGCSGASFLSCACKLTLQRKRNSWYSQGSPQIGDPLQKAVWANNSNSSFCQEIQI